MSHCTIPLPSASAVPARPPASPDWIGVARLCRRICLLAERGDLAEADRLRTGEFATAVAALQADEASHALFAREADRVAHATLVAEQLAPLLAARLPATTPASFRVENKAAPAAPPRSRPSPPTDLADFIDEMIALDRRTP
ncbi:MAG: hypothetical protein Q8N18_03465 [Opitutaceae bacterium]|nr:hypothetical protein [Opitutaceae bacterium]